MPLIFSPISEDILESSPIRLYPKSGCVLRQMGRPPAVDRRMAAIVNALFDAHGFTMVNAGSSTAWRDYLVRILGLIRGTGLTVAIISDKTRATAFANIALELGFAALCGKPLIIVKSSNADVPSDLTRTDWIEYDPDDEGAFRARLTQAMSELEAIVSFENAKLFGSLNAPRMDCAVAFERIIRAFLLSGDQTYVDHARTVRDRLVASDSISGVDDLNRLKGEIETFIHMATNALE